MRRRAARFLALTWPDRRLLIQAIVGQPVLRLALWTVGFRRCHAVLNRLAPYSRTAPRAPGAALEEATRAAALVRSAGLCGMLDRRCLTQSLTLWWLLRRRGIESEICIGVRKVGDSLEAHAWVEHSGIVLGEERDVSQRFTPLASTTDMSRLDGLSTL